jgi:protein ImuB
VPTTDSKTLLKLLQLDLESRPPIAPVFSVYLKAEATSPRTIQRELFEPSGPEPEKLEITLARIAAIVGKDRVGSPVLLNTHKPGSFQLKKFLPLAAGKVRRDSPENPLLGWERRLQPSGVGSTASGQPTPTPLRWRGTFILSGAADGMKNALAGRSMFMPMADHVAV